MTGDHKPILFSEIEPPKHLLGGILARVALARRRAARVKLVAASFGLLASVTALLPAFWYLLQEFYTSGFYDYFSLLFTDHSVAIAHWQELLLSLTEALPSIAILVLLGVVFVLLSSARG